MNPLLEYLPPIAEQSPPAASGAGKYFGAVAAGYDAKREQSPKWICEQRLIEALLSDLPAGSIVLDCPVGTGRFFDCYRRQGLNVVGIDLSGDMLAEAALKLVGEDQVRAWIEASTARNTILPFRIRNTVLLMAGDIRDLPVEDQNVDAAVMCRLTRWLSPEDCQQALRELQRVTRKRIIWTARVANHPHARSRELFEAALDGWRITRDEPGYVMDYRILMAEPA